jgi:hypothetical protein
MAVTKEFKTAGDYWSELVEPDFQEHQADIADLRRALHSAGSLFHMADWVYQTHPAAVSSAFTFLDRKGISCTVTDEIEFANALQQQSVDFGRIRGVANASKHLVLRSPGAVPDAPSHAANTRVATTGWGQGPFGKGPFGGTPRVMLEAANGDLEFTDIAANVRQMWLNLNAAHHWW